MYLPGTLLSPYLEREEGGGNEVFVQEFQVLVLVIFSGFVSTVFIGDVCSPELMKVFKTLFAKRTRC